MAERIALIGCGAMGKNHARTLRQQQDDISISYIVDSQIENAEAVRKQFGDDSSSVSTSIDSINSDNTDCAIIASPSNFHADQAAQLMSEGIHVLVEKPVALDPEGACGLGQLALSSGVVLMAGHVELFNPVVKEMRRLLGETTLKSLRFKRLSTVTDQDRLKHEVVNDLMLHDITIANQFLDSEPSVVHSFGRRDTVFSPDPAEAILRYDDGVDVHLRASRAFTGGKVRQIEAETKEAVFHADLLTKEITRRQAEEGQFTPSGTLIQDVRTSSFFAQDFRQPLQLEQKHFLDSIRGETTPEEAGVSIGDAIKVLKLTREILDKMIMIDE